MPTWLLGRLYCKSMLDYAGIKWHTLGAKDMQGLEDMGCTTNALQDPTLRCLVATQEGDIKALVGVKQYTGPQSSLESLLYICPDLRGKSLTRALSALQLQIVRSMGFSSFVTALPLGNSQYRQVLCHLYPYQKPIVTWDDQKGSLVEVWRLDNLPEKSMRLDDSVITAIEGLWPRLAL